ncbi:MAG: YbhB/YbcL family Raf kinase inhibitor-like protein [Oligoflexia bacterium]|nr:YbhB/YbcL family Raf kinase inhibitor-like protein [Oligoflexia bacterium]
MKIESAVSNGEPIDTKYAFGKYNKDSHVELSSNINPEISWSDFPAETKSFALVCVDIDVPTKPDDVNQEGKTVPYDLPRADFYHWVLANIPANVTKIAEGSDSSEITAKGKDHKVTSEGIANGMNNYTQWFEGDADMGGQYFGYDGPCPPWNDERIHRYYFRVYALNTDSIAVDNTLTGDKLVELIKPHVIDSAEVMGTYHIYPDAKPAN